MATTKANTQTKIPEVKTTVKETAKADKASVKEAANVPAKVTVKAAAKTEEKAAVKAPAAQAAKKTVKKPAAKKAPLKTDMTVQFQGRSYSQEDLVKIAKDVWRYDLKQKASDLASIELYVKPEESAVYYVMNQAMTGSFAI